MKKQKREYPEVFKEEVISKVEVVSQQALTEQSARCPVGSTGLVLVCRDNNGTIFGINHIFAKSFDAPEPPFILVSATAAC